MKKIASLSFTILLAGLIVGYHGQSFVSLALAVKAPTGQPLPNVIVPTPQSNTSDIIAAIKQGLASTGSHEQPSNLPHVIHPGD